MSTFVKKVTSAVAGLAIVFSIVSPIAGVSAAYTSLDAAKKLSTLGVIVDNSSNPADYRLGDNLPRKEAVKVMMNLSSVAVVDNCEGKFDDLSSADWACKYAETALANGMVAANASFGPDRLLSKIEGLKMVFQGRDLEKGSDSDWRKAYVDAAVAMGIADNFTDYDTAVTRGQFFIWAANAVDVVADGEDDLLCEILGTCEDGETDGETDGGSVVTGDNEVSLSPESPMDGDVAANTPRTALLAFDVTAGSTDLTLKTATLDYTGLSDARDIDEVSIYRGNEKVSKTKNFSDNDLDLSFDKQIVVQAGQTVTFTVAATVVGGTVNESHRITLVNLDTNEGDIVTTPVVGATLRPVSVTNKATLEVKDDTASDTVTVGETTVIAGFSLEEKDDNEDVLLKSITFHVNGSIDAEDDLSNIELFADGVSIASDLMVNNDDEIVADLDFTIPQDDKIDFELKAVVTGSIGETIHVQFENADDIYAVGATTGINVSFVAGKAAGDPSVDIATPETIEGSEINVSFEKSDIDEAKPNAEEVLVGTLNLLAATDDYEVTEVQVVVTATGIPVIGGNQKKISDVITAIELDGVSDDNTTTENNAITNTTATYRFDDIALSANSEFALPLTFDIEDENLYNGVNLDFQVVITEVEDTEENITYTATLPSATNNLSDILSSTSLDNKDITVETGKLTVTNVAVTDRDLVLGNNVETVLYKAKLSVGDADTITINDFDLRKAAAHTMTEDLDKVIESATLNIGGVTKDADIDADSVDFTSINVDVAAGADNVEVLVTAVLKDNDSVSGGDVIALELNLASLDVDDSDGDTLPNVVTTAANNKLTKTTLLSQGTFEFAIIQNGDNKDDIETVVLAGSTDVAIAEYKMEADLEDMDVNSLKIRIPAAASAPARTLAVATTTANVVATPNVAQVMTVTIPASLDDGAGTLTVSVNGTAYNGTDAASLAAAIDAGEPVTSTVSNHVITVTANVAGTAFTVTGAQFNGSDESSIEIATVTPNKTASAAVAAVKTITLGGGNLQAGHTVNITVDGTAISQAFTSSNDATLAALATKIAATSGVATAVVTPVAPALVNDVLITVTAATAWTDVVLTNPSVVSAVTGDFSDTFTNIRLMDGSKVIAADGVATLVGTDTVIEFKDFTVSDADDEINGTLVVDVISYDTNGDVTSAELGNVVVSNFAWADADVDGIQSDNTIPAQIFGTAAGSVVAQGTQTVAIVPVTVDVAVTQTFGNVEPEAKLTLTINTGNNTLDDDDVKITDLTLSLAGANFTAGALPQELASVENDDNNTLPGTFATVGGVSKLTLTTAEAIVDGDVWTFNIDTVAGKDKKVKLSANGIDFTVDGNPYTSSNDDEISFGTYTN